jgi:hypothetical protein
MDYITQAFKYLWSNESKEEVEGYVVMSDKSKKASLVLVKESDKYWKTRWCSDNTTIYKKQEKPFNTIFINTQ